MTYPTAEEIRAAREAIDRDGPIANTTMSLCAIVLSDPIFKAIRVRLRPGSSPVDEAVIMSAIATGLNYGLRIGELRTGGKP